MSRPLAPLLCSILALALSGCASSGNYPSLARRPAERIRGSAEVVTPRPPPPDVTAPPSTDLKTRLASLVEQARMAHQRFVETRDHTEKLIAAASDSAVASDKWSAANIALADLESTRSDSMIALADLDELYVAERMKHFNSVTPTAKAIDSARDQIEAWVADENSVLTRLHTQLLG